LFCQIVTSKANTVDHFDISFMQLISRREST
jgi:hypothetical protein